MTISLATLLLQETKSAIYTKALSIATALGLPVSTWQEGDPTRSLYHLESEVLSTLEVIVVGFIRAGFLDFAAEIAESDPDDAAAQMWLKIRAEQDFGVEVPEATYATTTVTLTNGGGGLYEDIEPGALTFKNSVTGKTYRNTSGGTLDSGPGTTLDVTIVADEAGSASSAGAGEIDEMVTTLLGVTCSNATAAVGVDEQAPSTTVQQCRDKLDSLSPAKGGYAYVARNADLTGTNAVTRVRAYPDSDTGDVLVYLAGPSGGVAEADRALVEEAILEWATPLCITPTVLAAEDVTVNVTYELWIYKSVGKTADEIEEAVEGALESMFAARPIGGDIVTPGSSGFLYNSLIESTIRGVFSQAFRASLASPSSNTALTNAQVAVLGTVAATINLVVDP